MIPLSERICDSILIATMLIAIYTDWRTSKIYNWLTFSGMGAALAVRGCLDGWDGLRYGGIGIIVGLAIQFVPFALNIIKAGDVKLLMMVGALEGWQFTLWGFLYGAAAFGVIAVIWLALDGELRASMRNITDYMKLAGVYQVITEPAAPASRKTLPWVTGLGVGFLVALLIKHINGSPSLL